MDVISEMKRKYDAQFLEGTLGRKTTISIRNIIVLTNYLMKFWETRSGKMAQTQYANLSHLKRNMLMIIDLFLENSGEDDYILVLATTYKSRVISPDIKDYDKKLIKSHREMSEEDQKRVESLHKNIDHFNSIMKVMDKSNIPDI